MKRIFIAVDLPDNIRKGLTGLGSSLPRARTVPADQLHLTLKFIGEIEGGKLLDIKECLQETALENHSFAIRLKGVGVFPPRSTPRVLWAGVKPKEPLILFRNRIENTLKTIGIPGENRKYSPHITLARLKNCPIQHLQQFLVANSFLESPEFSVNGFSLYSSTLTPKGAIHTLLQRYDFT